MWLRSFLMISRRSAAYSSMTRRAPSKFNDLGDDSSLPGGGSLGGFIRVMVGRDQKGPLS
jgi:hypothetical protein